MSLRTVVARAVLWYPLKWPVPSGGAIRAGDGSEGTYCFAVLLRRENDIWIVVQRTSLNGVHGKAPTDRPGQGEMFSAWDQIHFNDFEIRHFYGNHALTFQGLTDYVWSGLTGLGRLHSWIKRWLARRRLQASGPTRARMDILRYLFDHRLQDAFGGVSGTDLVLEIHGVRWDSSEAAYRYAVYYAMQLESLSGTEDAAHVDGPQRGIDGSYKLSPKGLATLAEYEVEDRRHRDSRILASLVALLTFFLAVFAGIDAWPTIAKWLGG